MWAPERQFATDMAGFALNLKTLLQRKWVPKSGQWIQFLSVFSLILALLFMPAAELTSPKHAFYCNSIFCPMKPNHLAITINQRRFWVRKWRCINKMGLENHSFSETGKRFCHQLSSATSVTASNLSWRKNCEKSFTKCYCQMPSHLSQTIFLYFF